LHFPAEFLRTFPKLSAAEIQNSLVAAGNLMKTIAALLLMCDARDISLSLTDDAANINGIWEPDLFLYDNYPGGIGHSQPLFALRDRLLQGALDLVRSCPCNAGCPSCVGPLGEVGESGKQNARRLLDALLPRKTSEDVEGE
jgi:DEAD/DEAH box helicase domain-containing protein